MDLEGGNKYFILFTHDLEAEVVPPNCNDETEGEYQTFLAGKTHAEVEVIGVNEDDETLDFRLGDGRSIYSVPREYFSVVPF